MPRALAFSPSSSCSGRAPRGSAKNVHHQPSRHTVVQSRRLVVLKSAQQDSGGFFSDAFKNALSSALERSDDESLDYLPDDLSAVPRSPPPPPPSAQEDMLGAALEASRMTLSRLQAIQAETERAIEREKLQIERLQFAVDKAQKDEAYYRVLRIIQERGMSDTE